MLGNKLKLCAVGLSVSEFNAAEGETLDSELKTSGFDFGVVCKWADLGLTALTWSPSAAY